MAKTYDFCGWATKYNTRCTDGLTIAPGAFDDCDGKDVPLVWNHQHTDPTNVLGHATLQCRPEGVYAYGTFNDTYKGQHAKSCVQNGDVVSMSICANQLRKEAGFVRHGQLREVSLVLAGANPGAFIEDVIEHGEISDTKANIYSGEPIELEEIIHSEEGSDNIDGHKAKEENENMAENKKTVEEIINSMNKEQQEVLYAMVGQALEEAGVEEEDDMHHNVFDDANDMYVGCEGGELSHAARMELTQEILRDCRNANSMHDVVLAHAEQYGIKNIDMLFPDYKNVNPTPTLYDKDYDWAADVLANVHHVPHARIKSMYADITPDEARAKGYTKGKKKTEEVFELLKRTTDPQTIYKKQKLDRDDIIDAKDFSVVVWLKQEMRMKLDQELARAFLIGDGRSSVSPDKISEQHIRPVWLDDELFTIHHVLPGLTNESKAEEIAAVLPDQVILAQDNYRGSGMPTLYMRKDLVSRCLLMKDANGLRIYKDLNDLALAMNVKKVVRVEVMTGCTRDDTEKSTTNALVGILVNMHDYDVGTDRGGEVSMFDDFDIDFNQMKYLMETRCSGALVNPKTAVAIETASVKGG